MKDFPAATPAEAPHRYNAATPIELLPMRTPQLLLHGTQDGRNETTACSLNMVEGLSRRHASGGSDRYNAAARIELPPMRTPQLLLHGKRDEIVPFELSERFTAASNNRELLRLEGGDHFDVIGERGRAILLPYLSCAEP